MSWYEANQAHLMSEIAGVRAALERCAAGADPPEEGITRAASTMAGEENDPPPAIEQLSHAFGLSPFERAILLMCAGVELDTSFARLIAAAQNDSRRPFPTFGFALAALSEPHWSALSPSAPLRRWRLIEVNTAESLTNGRIRIDERVLHYLAGVSHLDDRLSGLLEWVAVPGDLPPSHQAHVHTVVRAWSSLTESTLAAVQLSGDDPQ